MKGSQKTNLKNLKKHARHKITNLESKTRELAHNTAQAAEFIAETVRAESRYFASLAMNKLTARLIGSAHGPHHDSSLEPFGGLDRH